MYIKKDTQNNLNPKVLGQLVLIYEYEGNKYEPNILSSYDDKGQVHWTLGGRIELDKGNMNQSENGVDVRNTC